MAFCEYARARSLFRPSGIGYLRRSELIRPALAGWAGLLLGMFTGWGYAQTIPFQLRVTSASSAAVVPNGANIGFSAAIGQMNSARLTATYVGSGKVTVAQAPQVFGSQDFTATLGATPPLTLNTGDSFIVDLLYKPTTANSANAQFNLPFTETTFSTNPPTVTQNLIDLNLQGTAPSFVLSYVLQVDLNVVSLQPGGTIPFPDTLINTTSQANLNVTNVGSGSGQITNIAKTGSTAFTLVGLPRFPVQVNSGLQLQVLVRYQPTAVESDSAQIQITYDSGAPVSVNLQGNGVSPMFSYTVIQGDQTTAIVAPGPIPLPDTNVGDKSSVVIQVKNTGNTSGTINSPPSITGGFQLSNLPVFPQVLKPGDSFPFTLTFVPTAPGDQTGQLLIGSDLLTVTGRGLGPKLVFSYVSGGTTTTLGTNDAVVFSPVVVGQTSLLDFSISNMGTIAAKVSNIGIGESKSPFSLSVPPNLPISLDPGQTAQFGINFAPVSVGFVNGTLRIDTTVVPLTGSGTPPPPLPTYTIQGPSGNADAQSQPAIRLKLASPYPLALTGVLTLSTSTDLVDDPAVQFATGGRTVSFVIPANGTDANFANQGPQVRLQTGTVASTITLTPAFATQSGGVDVTPGSPATLQFAVAAAPPVLIAVQPLNETASSFALNITGYSTTRALTSVTLQFTAAAGLTLGTSQATVDIRQATTLWFQSTASQAFGGQFTITLPFTLQGTPPTGKTLLQTIASVAVTVSNDRGTSNSLQATLP
jgi:hypothetical protein